jgi:protein-disulfide isomerase
MTSPRRTDDDRVSFTLRRTHLFAAGGAAAGFAAGVLFMLALQNRRPAIAAGGAQAARAAQALPPIGERVVEVSAEGRPFRGRADAPVTIIEFTDYQCPFCRRHFETTLPAILERYGDRVRYVVRNFPIPQLHPTAPAAAAAAECAFEQNRFWEYHDRLFLEPSHDNASLKQLARAAGLNAARFDRCLDGGVQDAVVERDVRDGVAAGVTGTPAFFVNGRVIEGAMPFEVFATVIEEALRAVGR